MEQGSSHGQSERIGVSQAESETISGQLGGALKRTFASLRHRDYLLFWSGAWLSNIGTWLQSVALGWLVLEMTNSPVALGRVNFASSIPVFLFSFPAGIWADRMDKGRLIIVAQTILMLLAFALGGMISLGVHSIPAIMAVAFLTGIAATFSFPAWQAIISEIVPREDLMNAIALNAMQFQSARLLGPTMAGFVVAAFGVAACFYLNAVSFLAVIGALFLIRFRPRPRENRRSPWEEFTEGWRYILGNRLVLYLLLGVGVMSVFGLTFHSVLMPLFARDILHGDARTLGLLMGAGGFGALAGAVVVAYLSGVVRRALLIKYGMLAFSLAIMVFAFSRNLFLSLTALAAAGFSSLAVISTLNTTLQSTVPQAMRGRVMSFFVWMFMGWLPFGSIMAGHLAEVWDPPRAVALSGAVILVLSLYLMVRFPKMDAPIQGEG